MPTPSSQQQPALMGHPLPRPQHVALAPLYAELRGGVVLPAVRAPRHPTTAANRRRAALLLLCALPDLPPIWYGPLTGVVTVDG